MMLVLVLLVEMVDFYLLVLLNFTTMLSKF